MADIFKLNIGTRVRCIFKGSDYFGCKGTVVGFEYDGWIKVKWDDTITSHSYHAMDVEIIKMVEYEQYEKLRQEADDLHEENRKLRKIIEEAKNERRG